MAKTFRQTKSERNTKSDKKRSAFRPRQKGNAGNLKKSLLGGVDEKTSA